MDKNLQAFLNANGFENIGNGRFFGMYRGYQVSGSASGQLLSVAVSAHLDEDGVVTAKNWLKENVRNYALQSTGVDCSGIAATFTGFGYGKKMIAFIENSISFISAISPADCCPFCGEPLEGNFEKGEPILAESYNVRVKVHDKCFDSFAAELADRDAAEAAAPKNYLRGAAGMLLGALVGGVLFGILYILGYIAWIAPLVSALLGSFLYGKFGGKNDKVKIIILWVITLVVIIAAFFITLVIQTNIEAAKYGLEINFVEFLKFGMQDKEFHDAFMRDIIITAVMTVVANGYITFTIIKTQKPQTSQLRRLS